MAKRRTRRIAHLDAPEVPLRDLTPVFAVLLGLALVAAVVVRLRLRDVPLERDEGEYAYFGQLILAGTPPYLTAYSTKFPGTYLAAAAAMKLFGETAAALRYALALTNIASAALLFLIVRRLFDRLTALASTAAFLVLSVTTAVLGTFAHATNALATAMLAGVLALMVAGDGPRGRLPWTFVAGMMFGTSILFKQHAAVFLLYAVLLIVVRTGGFRKAPGRVALEVAILGAGVAVPLAALAAWVVRAHAFRRFWWWTFVYANEYVRELPVSVGVRNLGVGLGRFVAEAPLLVMLFLGGLVLAAFHARLRGSRLQALAFVACSFLATIPGRYFREHYFVMVLPAAAMLIGVAVRRMTASPRFAPLGIGLLAFALAGPIVHDRELFFDRTPDEVSRAIYGLAPFVESKKIARFVASHTKPGDRVAVMGSEPEICFYANRRSATGYIWTYPLTEDQPFASRMQREMIAEVEAARPEIAIVLTSANSWSEGAPRDWTIFHWMERYFPSRYRLIGIADTLSQDETVYRWGADAEAYRPRSRDLIFVWKRI